MIGKFYTRSNLNKDTLSEFESVLTRYYNSEQPTLYGVLTVKECAKELNLSVNYFGDLIKSETGRSAKDHIQEYVVDQAKTKLLGTKQSIGQIAYSLGFEYPQGFNKLFKARVGVSPGQFRSMN